MAGTIDQEIAVGAIDDTESLPVLGKLHEWVVTVDHKRLGLMYIMGGLFFFLIAGLQAMTIRLQLAVPDAGIVPPQVFNRLLTMHGTAMVFLVGMPILTGFFNYLVPLMIGARDLAFPRLNAFGFWLWFFGARLLYFSYIGGDGLYGAGSAPDVGWFAYAPLTELPFSRGNSTDYWILSIFLTSVGTTATAINIITIAFISLSVWAHHMFAVGMTPPGNSFFAASSMLVGVPTGIKIFNWLGTMWGGKLRFRVPMLFSVAFLFQFLIAGLTGIMLAVAPLDWQVTDTYFVVTHFHYVLVGAIVFMIFAAIYYWFPKATGRMLGETLGKWHFWLFLIGFHLTFDTMHFAGLQGMPRRIYTFQPGRGLDTFNLVESIGALVQGIAVLILVINIVRSLISGEIAGDDPWDAWTLEWSTTSPPPEYNFDEPPVVRSRRPLWDLKHPDDPDWKYE